MKRRKQFLLVAVIAILFVVEWQSGYADVPSEKQKRISFSGLEWEVDTSAGKTMNPGQNYFSSSEDSVWVDSTGWLHLKIHDRYQYQKWVCASVHSTQFARYGIHRFRVIGYLGSLDKNVVLGLFLYQPNTKMQRLNAEIDYEFSTWGFPKDNHHGQLIQPCSNAQVVLWPSGFNDQNLEPAFLKQFFLLSPELNQTTHDILWRKDDICFRSYWYDEPFPSTENLMFVCDTNSASCPAAYFPVEEDQMVVNMNLWLNNDSKRPSHGQPVEVLIKYEYVPLSDMP